MKQLVILVLALNALAACTKKEEEANDNLIPFEMVKGFPHDVTAFTEGLVIYNGKLYESTGHEGTSWIAEVDLATGKHDKKVILDKKYFGEGITILNNKIYQLTYQTHEGFVYDLNTYQKLKTFNYPYEGWGMTHNGKNLIVSDGTDVIHFIDTVTLKDDHVIRVKEYGVPVNEVNELEYVDGYIYANVWKTPYILKIDPTTGEAVARIDLTPLGDQIAKFNGSFDVLNGIAYEKKTKTFLVTGKYWPVLFAIKLKPKEKKTQ